MRLLFVDDDDRVLAGLRRRLHGRCPGWRAEFAAGGAAGLAALERSRFDAVISDMRMPQVDGARVLAETARRHPRAARLVLSGHAEGRGVPRLGSCAHRFLDKPCATDALVSEVELAVARRALVDTLDDPQLDALWRCAPGLVPGLPEVLATLGGEGGSPDALAETILDEEADWARVLAVCAAVRSDALALDARPARALEVMGGASVLAVLVGLRLQQAAGGEWPARFAAGTALAVASHATGRARELSADELGDLLLASLLQPLCPADPDRWPLVSWLLGAWGVPPRTAAALAPGGSKGAVGQALRAARRDDSDRPEVPDLPPLLVPEISSPWRTDPEVGLE